MAMYVVVRVDLHGMQCHRVGDTHFENPNQSGENRQTRLSARTFARPSLIYSKNRRLLRRTRPNLRVSWRNIACLRDTRHASLAASLHEWHGIKVAIITAIKNRACRTELITTTRACLRNVSGTFESLRQSVSLRIFDNFFSQIFSKFCTVIQRHLARLNCSFVNRLHQYLRNRRTFFNFSHYGKFLNYRIGHVDYS